MNARRLALCSLLGIVGVLGLAAASQADSAAPAQALVHAPKQDFVANPPGTYDLPPIQSAANGWVLDGDWVPRRLSNYTHGAITLLSFVYTYCVDPIGCPLAYATMMDLKTRVLADTALHGKVRFVSISFDPSNDTPEAMQVYGAENSGSRALPWNFLTTYSTRFLLPILQGYGQDVEVEVDDQGHPTRTRTHMLKLFLIDARGQVREIYSAAFLHPQVMFNDIKTLALESEKRKPSGGPQATEP